MTYRKQTIYLFFRESPRYSYTYMPSQCEMFSQTPFRAGNAVTVHSHYRGDTEQPAGRFLRLSDHRY
jgi:hypothetical protein